ncbi:MAG TPA: hypothetical protein DCE42_21345 [Myxococcales bacterium]|nr:hypothetical protein [Deltaproteobacteria bacterium]MBU53427.1 hypothetical protein [Deltaproteobacteria bacterium]HAA57325.1 hypothetical protein [Myxococcales bacterium]
MGHYIGQTESMFDGVNYNYKTSAEVREAMTTKVNDLQGNISNREERILKIREEYSIDAERLATLVMRFKENKSNMQSYEHQDGPIVPAGVIANIIQERSMIDSERKQIRKLELVLRNLRDEEFYKHPRTGELCTRQALHYLDDDELEYLGF